MILRCVEPAESAASPGLPDTRPGEAWELFRVMQETLASGAEGTASVSSSKHAVITQPAHARLAGVIAGALHPDLFGELPGKVLESIAGHDRGWASADLAALEADAPAGLRSFVALSPGEAVPSWRACIRLAEQHSTLAEILVSRHFCLLADDGDTLHQQFRREETHRRQAAESAAPCSASDLERYMSALGFCDLLSLYLCCGMEHAAVFPLAHPADPRSKHAEKVTLRLKEGRWTFDRPVLQQPLTLALETWDGSGASLQRSTMAVSLA